MSEKIDVEKLLTSEFEEELGKILLEAFLKPPEGGNDVESNENGCKCGCGGSNQDLAILNLEESVAILDLEEKDSYIVESCPKCKDGWLKKACRICNGTGLVNGVVCTKCRGSGFYVLRPTQHYEGKKCFTCNGSGRKIVGYTTKKFF
jgi:hypothetical protein